MNFKFKSTYMSEILNDQENINPNISNMNKRRKKNSLHFRSSSIYDFNCLDLNAVNEKIENKQKSPKSRIRNKKRSTSKSINYRKLSIGKLNLDLINQDENEVPENCEDSLTEYGNNDTPKKTPKDNIRYSKENIDIKSVLNEINNLNLTSSYKLALNFLGNILESSKNKLNVNDDSVIEEDLEEFLNSTVQTYKKISHFHCEDKNIYIEEEKNNNSLLEKINDNAKEIKRQISVDKVSKMHQIIADFKGNIDTNSDMIKSIKKKNHIRWNNLELAHSEEFTIKRKPKVNLNIISSNEVFSILKTPKERACFIPTK